MIQSGTWKISGLRMRSRKDADLGIAEVDDARERMAGLRKLR
jgi:hypothetical protein